MPLVAYNQANLSYIKVEHETGLSILNRNDLTDTLFHFDTLSGIKFPNKSFLKYGVSSYPDTGKWAQVYDGDLDTNDFQYLQEFTLEEFNPDGTPGGADHDIQFNNGGVFGNASNMVPNWDFHFNGTDGWYWGNNVTGKDYFDWIPGSGGHFDWYGEGSSASAYWEIYLDQGNVGLDAYNSSGEGGWINLGGSSQTVSTMGLQTTEANTINVDEDGVYLSGHNPSNWTANYLVTKGYADTANKDTITFNIGEVNVKLVFPDFTIENTGNGIAITTSSGGSHWFTINDGGIAFNTSAQAVLSATTSFTIDSDAEVFVKGARINIEDVLNLNPRSAAPSTPTDGDMYYNSTTDIAYIWDGTIWQALY